MKMSDQEFEALVRVEQRLARLSVEAKEMADESGFTRRELADRMGHASPSTVQRIVKGAAYRSTVETLAHLAWACGYELEMNLRPRGAGAWTAPAPSQAHAANVVYIAEYVARTKRQPASWTLSQPQVDRCVNAVCGS